MVKSAIVASMKLSLTKDTIAFGGVDFLFRLVAFFTFPFFAAALGPGEFGLLALVITLPNLLALLFNWIYQAVPRFYWERDRKRLLSTALALQLMLSCGLLLFLPFDWIVGWRWIVGGQIAFQLYSFAALVHRLHFARWNYLLLVFIYQTLLIALTLYFGVVRGEGVFGYVVGMTLAAAVVAPVALWSIARHLCWGFSVEDARSLWRLGRPMLFSAIAFWLFSSIDRWMLEWICDLEQVGFYSVAHKFARMVNLAILAFGQAWGPYAMKARSEQLDYRTLFAKTFLRWSAALTLIAAAVCLFGREALFLMVPASYWPAAPIIPILIAGVALYGTTQVTASSLTVAGRTDLFAVGSAFAALLNIGLNLWWIPSLGPMGAACATLISYGALCAAYLFWAQRHHPTPLQARPLSLFLVLLALSVATALGLGHLPWQPWQIAVKGVCLALLATIAGRALSRDGSTPTRQGQRALRGGADARRVETE